MKRALSLILIVLMSINLLIGCSNDDSSASSNPPPKTTTVDSKAPPATGKTPTPSESKGAEPKTPGGAFDDFPRPIVKNDGKLTVAYIHLEPSCESQSRSIYQAENEAAHRGWRLIEMVFKGDSEWADYMNNAINQGVDAIILGSTNSMQSKVDLIKKARDAGIGVYNSDNQVVDGIIMNSTMPNAVAASELFYQIGEDCGWNANICILTVPSIQVHVERTIPMAGIASVYPTMHILDTQDAMAGGSSPDANSFDIAKTWLQKYGNEITGIIASCDYYGGPAAEAAKQSGDLANPNLWVCGIDGGSNIWSNMRQGGYFKYNYAQPFELFVHKVFEAIDQIQVQGLNPGDKGCILLNSGETLYSRGKVVTQDNVPDAGQSIHAVFDYYGEDPKDPDAWYNWKEGNGVFIIAE